MHGWLERARPTVFVLTDGSGSRGRSRLEATTRLLARMGARPGTIYGRFTDRELYAALLAGNPGPFLALARELAAAFVATGHALVVGDALEGYNPSHDVCRLLLGTAVGLARGAGARIVGFDFALATPPEADSAHPTALRVELDAAALARKLQAARAYPELGDDVEGALAPRGAAAFRIEYLRPMTDLIVEGDPEPFYERYGEQRVGEGHYAHVLRYREHMVPLMAALREALGR